jgi:hypothetical protein
MPNEGAARCRELHSSTRRVSFAGCSASPQATTVPSSPSLRDDLQRWTTAINRKRWAQEAVRTLVWLAIGGVVAVGVQRVPLALLAVGIQPPAWLLESSTFAAWVWGLYAATATLAVLHASVRAWHQRIDEVALARRLDREHGTEDVLATALALEEGAVTASPDLAQFVQRRARACAQRVGQPVPPFAAPGRALAMAGALAAGVALLPASAESLVDLAVRSARAAEHRSELADPNLSPESLDRLARMADALAELERRPVLDASAREHLRASREQLEAIGRDQTRSLSRLSRAEQPLRELQRLSREQGLHDPQQLRAMDHDRLAQALAEAIEQGNHDTAAALAQEMARRLEDANDEAMASMARSLEQALRDSPSPQSTDGDADPGGSASADERGAAASQAASHSGEHARSERAADDPRTRWRDAARGVPPQMNNEDRDSAREALREMAKEMARAAGKRSADRTLERAIDEIRRARSEQLAQMNAEGSGGREPTRGEGRSEEGGSGSSSDAPPRGGGNPVAGGAEGVPLGMPAGKPGAGGGRGSEALDPREPPLVTLHPADKVEATPDGANHGSVTVIQRFADGHRDDQEYEDLHHEYESVAESAVRREQIPLTRRDYIRNYFQAVRPR